MLLNVSTGWCYSDEEKNTIKQFISDQFNGNAPKPKRLWVKAELKSQIQKILSRPIKQLSYRYWHVDNKSIWILDEIGKERDITTAVIIKGQQIEQVKVLVYRESRGGEVQVPWFTQQFVGASPDDNWQKKIDSISGATLSVNAMKKQAELALFLQKQISQSKDKP
ncbi:FMN-binding protein [Marinicella rhabdoformis]|uniref:FMN-binding protein n=1 Tax=Marinicella rhabdoformis TaxID=2580566 RepID=UPI0015D0839A|nr:FMN-binding protein [Marinicella rhabdoformis]